MTDMVPIPRALLQDLIDDVSEYAASREFKPREKAWRDDVIERACALLAPTQQPSTEIQPDEEDRWISVDVRTPATADFVIATNMRGINLAQYFQGNWIGMGRVTHWMPLPNMPTAASREES
ncbi:DUF551 domain-containing protein [Burkholderia pseudomallei]|uniref:DUF551 domain-containing protein n=1 Tax=Burkholderia pseudomallei TaxID=28450 RepID=UPI00052A8DAD|nr:DUF551 domain-containing protein [Burkholderia pseudomallei]AIV86368.1 hypothetical protein X995_5188 [Burkholderia pseudomallei B03]AIV93060.1 hypothetical protein X996_5900 [Burkholderia pseudomallei A79A]KGX94446.1 hypothetical protein X997_5883 [Burkholderia pseudomallei A79C]KGX96461.1 hypothetical protein Y023_5063 [Burkholderia pseudomallei A79D]